MILSGKMIETLLETGVWETNTKGLHYGPNSVDVTLSSTFFIPNTDIKEVDPLEAAPDNLFKVIQDFQTKVLKPGEFILASVNERFNADNPVQGQRSMGIPEESYFVPMYEGRSTLARLGIVSHLSAGFGDYGFKGSFTLEIVNNSPWEITLYPHMRIGQVYFVMSDKGVAEHPYVGYDQGDCKPQLPRLGEGRF
jgi:dCTP deaminase